MLESDSFGLAGGFFFSFLFSFKAVVHSRKEALWQTLFMVALWGRARAGRGGGGHLLERSLASSVALLRACSGGSD